MSKPLVNCFSDNVRWVAYFSLFTFDGFKAVALMWSLLAVLVSEFR